MKLLIKILKKYADSNKDSSWAAKLRKKRFALFRSFVSKLPLPLKILDVGGTQLFWEKMDACREGGIEVWLLNVTEMKAKYPNFKILVHDAKDMGQFKDKEFDVVFSNSTIEHIPSYDDQCCLATEIRRIGKRYFLQTPNRYFFIEPHFLFPFFQFFPQWVKVWLLHHFAMGWFERMRDKEEAIETINSIRMLSKRELKTMFPDGQIIKEKFLGLTKSFIVYNW